MAVTRERFDSGLSYEAYKAQMTRNRDRLEAIERDLELSAEDLAPFRALPKPLNVLALAEDWCGDVIANLPVMGRVANDSGSLNLRVFLRDQNEDLMNQYLNQGTYKSIPVFVFFDQDMREIGRFVERPASVTELRAQRQREIHTQHPEFGPVGGPPDQLPEQARTHLAQMVAEMRQETAPFANREVIKELRAIVARVPAAS